jgi:hypothetical protein
MKVLPIAEVQSSLEAVEERLHLVSTPANEVHGRLQR